MNNTLRATTVHIDRKADFSARLSAAHARIEKTFLDGGAVLVSVIEILNDLTAILDGMTGTMNGETTATTISGLHKTIADLATLPETEQKRQAGFENLTSLCATTDNHIDDIRETIRYLKTFAITVKITGAGLAEFAAFADEIRDRIQSGADEVSKFAAHLNMMRMQLNKARNFSTTILSDFVSTIPQIITGLNENSARISRQHQEMGEIAGQVRKIAQGVQGKIGSVLSALQIGDITRQRIEHIQSTLLLFDEFAGSADGATLGADGLSDLKNTIFHMASAQMEETAIDFQRECRKIFTSISSFTDDAARILSLRDELIEKTGRDGGNVLALMEKDIAEACKLAGRVQESSADAGDVVHSVTQSAQDLLHGIEVLRSIKIDIHYMALNSNLRCSKLGEEGKPVNVVSGELRTFAAKLETPADAIVSELHRVEGAINSLTQEGKGLSGDLSLPLQDALAAIQGAKGQMESGMDALAREGQAVFSRISAAVVKLDFESELGDTFNECCGIAADLADGPATDLSAFEKQLGPLTAKIYKLYTMAQEREIHIQYLSAGVDPSKTTNPVIVSATSSDDDEDLFADALF